MVIDKTAQHMPADGGVWVTNNVKYHAMHSMVVKRIGFTRLRVY